MMLSDSRGILSSDDECVPLTFYFPSNSDGEESDLSVGSLHVELQPLTSTTSLSSNQTLDGDGLELAADHIEIKRNPNKVDFVDDKAEKIPQKSHNFNIEEENTARTTPSNENKSNPPNRQEWAFTLYDFDGRHRITKEDLSIMMNTLYETLKSKAYVSTDQKQSFQLRFSLMPNSSSSNESSNHSNHSPAFRHRKVLSPSKLATDLVTKDKPTTKMEKSVSKELPQPDSGPKQNLNDLSASPKKQRSSRARHFEKRGRRESNPMVNGGAKTESPNNSKKCFENDQSETFNKLPDKQTINNKQLAAEKKSEEIVRRRHQKHKNRKSLAMVNVIDWLQKEKITSYSDQEETSNVIQAECISKSEAKTTPVVNDTEQSNRVIVHEHKHVHEHHHHYYYHHCYGN